MGGGVELSPHIASMVERIEISADATASIGYCESSVWAGELQGIVWPRVDEIDIIEFGPQEGANGLRLIVSLPLVLEVNIPVDVSFSIWDSVDKELVPMGGRTIEVEEMLDTEATITFDIHDQGAEEEEIALVDAEIDVNEHYVDLGEIDLFEPEDDHFDDEEPLGE